MQSAVSSDLDLACGPVGQLIQSNRLTIIDRGADLQGPSHLPTTVYSSEPEALGTSIRRRMATTAHDTTRSLGSRPLGPPGHRYHRKWNYQEKLTCKNALLSYCQLGGSQCRMQCRLFGGKPPHTKHSGASGKSSFQVGSGPMSTSAHLMQSLENIAEEYLPCHTCGRMHHRRGWHGGLLLGTTCEARLN